MRPPVHSARWARQRERGSPGLTATLLWLALRIGPSCARVILPPCVAWFLLTAPGARAASRDYLGRVFGRPARLREVVRHFGTFARAVLERVFLLSGRGGHFDIRVEGLDQVQRILASGRGCMLLGAHLGSFEVLRELGRHAPVPVRPVMFRRNAGALTVLLDRLAPGLRDSVIEIGEPGSMLRVKEAIDRGEMVAMLADRSPGDGRLAYVPFLGSAAPFPTGPIGLAAALHVPVILFHGIWLEPRRYLVRFAFFAERIVLGRASRDADLHHWVAAYAAALEAACRAYPYNWFNFFPFWESHSNAIADPPPVRRPERSDRDLRRRTGAGPRYAHGANGSGAGTARAVSGGEAVQRAKPDLGQHGASVLPASILPGKADRGTVV